MRRPVRVRAALALASVLTLGVTAACSSGAGPSSEPTKDLEVVSWWTSGSEQQALEVLFAADTKAHPDVTVANATVAGGGGSNAQVVLAQRLLAGDPPDVWQTFPGGALNAYVTQSTVQSASPVYSATGLAAVLPPTILAGLTVKGQQYGVPTSAHRGNTLFSNTAVLKKAGVALPTAGYTAGQLSDDLATLKKAGATPLCLGAKDPFTTAALFENVLLGVVGPSGWKQIGDDRFDWSGSQAHEALSRFGTLLDAADPEAAGLSWDQATKKLAEGGCGFEAINDSAYGELVKDGAVEGRDFGALAYPGTEGSYVAVVDTFVAGRKATNARNASDFLAVIAAPDTQLAFSKAKGSVPVRSDVDVSSLSAYQQAAAKSLRSDTVLWSIVHGEATSPQFQAAFYAAVETYVRSRDPKAFAKTLSDAMGSQVPPH